MLADASAKNHAPEFVLTIIPITGRSIDPVIVL
jgi:hypothetical protein